MSIDDKLKDLDSKVKTQLQEQLNTMEQKLNKLERERVLVLEQKVEEMPTKKQLKEELVALEKAIDKKTADAYTLKAQSADAIADYDKKIKEDDQKLKEEL